MLSSPASALSSPARANLIAVDAGPLSTPLCAAVAVAAPPPPKVSLLTISLSKLRGSTHAPPSMPLREAVISGLLTLLGMGILVGVQYSTPGARATCLFFSMGSFGATAVLVFAAPAAPLSQPRNVVVGHALCAIIGVACRIIIADSNVPGTLPAASALAVALGVTAMAVLGVTHPPGGATALIAVVGGPDVAAMGWWFVLNAIAGASVLVGVSLLGNNLAPSRRYPLYW